MDLFVDDRPYTGEHDASWTVGQLAQTVCDAPETQASVERRMVVAVACNGQPVADATLDAILASPAQQFDRLDLTTMPIVELIEGTLQQAGKLFGDSTHMRNQCADLLAEGQHDEAMQHLRSFCETWHQVQECVRVSAQLMNVNLDTIQVDGSGFAAVLDTVKNHLHDLKLAMENRDSVLVGDILRYEFEEPTEKWLSLMNQLEFELTAG